MTDKPKFELVPALPAANEKTLAVCVKNIPVFDKGMKKAGAEFFGYAFLLGRELNIAAEALPRGQFEPWAERHFPKIPLTTAYRYREFAGLLEPKIRAVLANAPTVGVNPTAGIFLNGKKLAARALPAILAAVPEVMDGKGMMDFMRGEKLLKEEETDERGGYKPDKVKLRAWLMENHPTLWDKDFDDLPVKVQHAFKKFAAQDDVRVSPEDEKILADNLAETTEGNILAILNGKQKLRFTLERKQKLALLAGQLADEMKKMLKAKG